MTKQLRIYFYKLPAYSNGTTVSDTKRAQVLLRILLVLASQFENPCAIL